MKEEIWARMVGWLWAIAVCGFALASTLHGQPPAKLTPEERIAIVLRETQPLPYPLGDRLQLYLWPVEDPPGDEAEIERTLRALTARGIAAYSSWQAEPNPEKSLQRSLRIATVQKRLGLRVGVNATSSTYGVFDGSLETAHIDADGKPFFDTSSSPSRKLGCPFSVRQRFPSMREKVDFFVRGYQSANLPLDFVVADWEIDGPIEWNDGWSAAKRCVRCREHIRDIDDFAAFQRAYRAVRSEIQRACYTSVVLKRFPRALVGNYGVYPNDGWRYWYDYYEKEPGPGVRVPSDQRAKYRPWVPEFAPSGYTFAMPVVYTWYGIWNWYDWASGDYRWFYNLLKVASNAGANTPASVPIVSWVHYTTTSPPRNADPAVRQFSESAYRELLWHMLLRGHDTFFLWCSPQEIAREVRPLHETWAAALEYKEFLDRGTPVTFEVPNKPGPVVSGLRLGSRVLVRRSDFDNTTEAVRLRVGGATLLVRRYQGSQILKLPRGARLR